MRILAFLNMGRTTGLCVPCGIIWDVEKESCELVAEVRAENEMAVVYHRVFAGGGVECLKEAEKWRNQDYRVESKQTYNI